MKVDENLLSKRDIQKFINSILSFWYLYLLLPVLALGVAKLYTHRMTDIYSVQAQILLKNSEVYDYQSNMLQGLGMNSSFNSYDEIESQKRVVKSTNLINESLNRLSLDVNYFIVGRIKTTEVFDYLPFKVSSKLYGANSYRSEFFIQIINDSSFSMRFLVNGEEKQKSYKFGEKILDYGFNFQVARTSQINAKTINILKDLSYMFRIIPRNLLVSNFKRNLEVISLDWTSILEVNIRDHIPARGVRFLDTLAKVYIENTLQTKRDINKNTILFIDKQIANVLGNLEEIELDLENYKENEAILNIGKEEIEYFSQLVKYEARLLEFNAGLNSLISLEKYILNVEQEALLPPSMYILSGDKYLQVSIGEFYNLQIEKSNSLFTKTQQNVGVGQIDKRIERMRKDLLVYIDNSKAAMKEAIKETEGSVKLYETKVRSVPKNQREIFQIKRKLEINEKLYTFLFQRKTETIIAEAGIIAETKVIEKPRSMGVVAPNKERVVLLFVSLGLILALSFSIVRMLFFDRIQSASELNELTSLKVMGQVFQSTANEAEGEHSFILNEPKGLLAESFRILRTNIEFFKGNNNLEANTTILVTSMLPSEGKTFSVLNLAIIFAMAGKKVLLLDLDLHKPRIHKTFGIKNKGEGVSSYLVGRSSFDEIIKPSKIDNLDIGLAGPIPPNASELIMGNSIDELLKLAKENYDYTFIDTPPTSLISDATVLMKKVDLGFFVINQRNATLSSIKVLENMVVESEKNKIALILNGVTKRKMPYYAKYMYSYGYGYGYGYGNYGYGYNYSNGYSAYGDDVDQSVND